MKGLKDFVQPYIAIRNENRGYAVSIVKAGMTAIGRSAGPVRAPLTELTPDQLGRLKKLIDATKPV
jgi:5-dehydro-4-deoxyglucarate dehydratase